MTPKRRLYAHSEIGDASEWDGTRVSCPHPPPTRPTGRGRLGTRVVVVGYSGGGDTGKIALSCQIAIEGWKEGCPSSTSSPLPPCCAADSVRLRRDHEGTDRAAAARRTCGASSKRFWPRFLPPSHHAATIEGGEGFFSRVEWLCNFTTLKIKVSIYVALSVHTFA